MKTLKNIVLLSMLLISSSCVFKDVFINNYDGAGCFHDLTPQRSNNHTYVDSLNRDNGFDTIVFMHFRMICSYDENTCTDDIKDYPEIHFGLTDEFINSDPEIENDISRRGILAKWYKYYVRGTWVEQNDNKYFDSYIMFEAKSKMDVIAIENVYLRFWGDAWIRISIGKYFKIQPNSINYPGTLTIELHKTDKYSERITSSPSVYGTGISEESIYSTDIRFEHNESDLNNDLTVIEMNYPVIFDEYKDKIFFNELK